MELTEEVKELLLKTALSARSMEYAGVFTTNFAPTCARVSVCFTVPVAGSIHSSRYVPAGIVFRVISSW